MRKIWDFLYGCRYILPGILAAAMAAESLSGYQAPVYAAPETTTAVQETETAAQETETAAVSLEAETETETAAALSEGSFDVEDGTYQGEGTGYGGKIAVTVTVEGGKITEIAIDEAAGEDSAFLSRAKGVVDRILEAQSLDVDTVSGATFSSTGILNAVKNALTGESESEQTVTQTTTKKAAKLETEEEADGYKDGTYTGSAQGFGGKIRVKVTIKNGKIKKISVTECSGEGSAYMNKARKLIKKMIKKQSTNVDAASGATYSSNGLIKAVRNALKKAAVNGTEEETEETTETTTSREIETETEVEADGYKDGTYTGSAEGFGGKIRVKVKIKKGKIKKISVTECSGEGSAYMNKAKKLIKKMIKQQNTDVDAASGATYSSNGLINAVRNALKKAAVNGTEEETEETETEEETKKSGKSSYADGIFYGTGEGYRGDLEVAVVIEDGEILTILVTQSEDDDAFLSKAKALLKDIVKKQTTKKVDTVSGATYSSKGLLQAVKDALKQSKKQKKIEDGEETSEEETTKAKTKKKETSAEETLEGETSEETTSPEETLAEESSSAAGESGTTQSGESSSETGSGTETTTAETTTASYKYKNGTYSVSTKCNPDDDEDFTSYTLEGNVKIENDRIVSITNLTGSGKGYVSYNDVCIEDASGGTKTQTGVVAQITALTSLDKLSEVDTVTGATCSSNAIIALCKAALKEAAN